MKKLGFLFIPFITLALISCSKTINVTIYSFDGEEIKCQAKNNLIDTSVITIPDGYTLEGLYTSNTYEEKYDLTKEVTEDITLYSAFTYESELTKINDSANIDLKSYIDSFINNTTSYIPSWNKEGFKGRWNYIDGVFLKSVVELYKTTNDEKYKTFFINYINYYISNDGKFINPKTGDESFNSNELDSICESNILFDAYEMTGDLRYLNAIEYTYNALKGIPLTTNNINYSHKVSYLNQIWLDGMYMYVPFLLKYANLKNDTSIYNTVKSQYEYIRNNMYNETDKLYYHGHDTTKSIFWCNSETGNSKNYWLRSMGWYIVSLVDSIELISDNTVKTYLTDLLKEALDGILTYKDTKTNLYYQLINKGKLAINVDEYYLSNLGNKEYRVNGSYVTRTINNYLESSGSSMISYALMKASRLNYLANSYKQEGKNTFEGIYSYLFSNNSLNNICITAGLGPASKTYRDSTMSYYLAEAKGSDDAKGTGPFIMAYIEYMK